MHTRLNILDLITPMFGFLIRGGEGKNGGGGVRRGGRGEGEGVGVRRAGEGRGKG